MTALPSGYEIVEDPDRIDVTATHAYLTRSYWAQGIPLDTVQRSIEGSHCVAVRYADQQVAFARVVTDHATFAYLADVYVLEEHRGRALSHAMLAHLQGHHRLQGLRRWALFTRDAQELYRQHGWAEYPYPDRMMVIDKPDIYTS